MDKEWLRGMDLWHGPVAWTCDLFQFLIRHKADPFLSHKMQMLLHCRMTVVFHLSVTFFASIFFYRCMFTFTIAGKEMHPPGESEFAEEHLVLWSTADFLLP